MAQVYGGDEVNAIVLDPGSAWLRAGWAGDDIPKATILSAYANVTQGERTGRRYGDEQIYLVRPHTEIGYPLKDGVVKDWDAAAELFSYGLGAVAPTAEPSNDYLADKPLLITETPWNPSESRRKTLEYALETAGAAAAYLMQSPVAALFGAGKGSGLVVDIGQDTSSITPIIDGLVLRKPARKSRRAGRYLSQQVAAAIAADVKGPVRAWYEVQSKEAVKPGEEPKWTPRKLPDGITESFHTAQIARIYDQYKESMVQIADSPLTATFEAPLRQFELPTGQTLDSSRHRFELGESLFTTAEDDAMDNDSGWNSKGLGISDLAIEAINACDVDARATLANNIVVTGGTSLVQGFTERLNQEITRAFPMLKVRIYAAGNIMERRNGAWIGGSITASLGTFHQLWVSRQEYDEVGAEQLIQKRFR